MDVSSCNADSVLWWKVSGYRLACDSFDVLLSVIGTVNGTNFTDGLDGLASSVTVLVATFFTVVAVGTKSGIEPITCAVVGALLGFLLFNVYPAKCVYGRYRIIWRLGGFVASAAYMLQMPIFIVIVGIIYLVEVLICYDSGNLL